VVYIQVPPDALKQSADTVTESFSYILPRMDSSQSSSDKVEAAICPILQKQESSPSTSVVKSLQKVDPASPTIMDKIQNVWKAIDATLDPVTKIGLTLSVLFLICGCIPVVGQIFHVIGLVVLFVTFLLWIGKLAEDAASVARPQMETTKSIQLDAERQRIATQIFQLNRRPA